MIRIVTLAAFAATLIALPANAQTQSISIPIAGKSPEQLQGEITKAAQQLCGREMVGATFLLGACSTCVQKSVSKAVAQVPMLADMAKPTRVATR